MFVVKEIFRSIQGEGYHVGRAATFVRLSGCNLRCAFCDTDHTQGEAMCGDAIVHAVRKLSLGGLVVVTGGEPMLQPVAELTAALHKLGVGFEVALETNGTLVIPDGTVDWIAVAPKVHVTPGATCAQHSGGELKVLYSGAEDLTVYDDMRSQFLRCYLQPMDGPSKDKSIAACVARVLYDPTWRLSIQMHKLIGVM